MAIVNLPFSLKFIVSAFLKIKFSLSPLWGEKTFFCPKSNRNMLFYCVEDKKLVLFFSGIFNRF